MAAQADGDNSSCRTRMTSVSVHAMSAFASALARSQVDQAMSEWVLASGELRHRVGRQGA